MMLPAEMPLNTYVYRNSRSRAQRDLSLVQVPRERDRGPDWVQSEKILKAQEKRDRKAKARGVEL